MSERPLLYVFRGWQPYLQISVNQSRKHCPNTEIVHITNSPDRCAAGTTPVDDSDLLGSAKAFEAVYKHRSVNPRSFELYCFQRWMIACEYMRKNNLNEAILMDGDVLLWSNVNVLINGFEGYEIAWTEPSQPGTVLINNLTALEKLCRHMFLHYESENGFSRIEQEYARREAQSLPLAITDMSILSYFKEDFPTLVGDTSQRLNGSRFDHSMVESDGFILRNGLKRFIWREGIPYATDTRTGELVRFHSMHFVGRSKGYMQVFADQSNLTVPRKLLSLPSWALGRIPSAIRRVKDKLNLPNSL